MNPRVCTPPMCLLIYSDGLGDQRLIALLLYPRTRPWNKSGFETHTARIGRVVLSAQLLSRVLRTTQSSVPLLVSCNVEHNRLRPFATSPELHVGSVRSALQSVPNHCILLHVQGRSLACRRNAQASSNKVMTDLACCCGRLDCAYLQHNNNALRCFEKNLVTAAQLGQVQSCFIPSTHKLHVSKDLNMYSTPQSCLGLSSRYLFECVLTFFSYHHAA